MPPISSIKEHFSHLLCGLAYGFGAACSSWTAIPYYS